MEAEPFARQCSVRRDSLAYRALERVDYADAYSIGIDARGPEVLERYARVMFGSLPPWVATLMGLRDRIVSVFGLKSSAALRAETAKRSDRIGPFAILTRLENEVLLGADDSHLNVRISIQSIEVDGGSEVRVITAVKFNNLLGRIYFLPVRPFHQIIVPAMMARAAHAI